MNINPSICNRNGERSPRGSTAPPHSQRTTTGTLTPFEEDPDICVELEDGVFYQASYDGTEVAITIDYPGLLASSHVSNQGTSPPKEFPRSASPTALSHAQKGRRSVRHATPKATPKRAAPTPGKPSKRKANEDTAEPSSKRYGFVNMPLGSHIQL